MSCELTTKDLFAPSFSKGFQETSGNPPQYAPDHLYTIFAMIVIKTSTLKN